MFLDIGEGPILLSLHKTDVVEPLLVSSFMISGGKMFTVLTARRTNWESIQLALHNEGIDKFRMAIQVGWTNAYRYYIAFAEN